MEFITQRQIEALHRTNGHVVLPYRARLTPLAQDWVKHNRIAVGYGDAVTASADGPCSDCCSTAPQAPAAQTERRLATGPAATLWWCDGPCGPAKAALMALAKESPIIELPVAQDQGRLVEGVRTIATEIKSGRAGAGVLLVRSGAAATVFANRCPSLRAVLGTCIDAVDQGVRAVAANVLIIEHPYKTLNEVRNLLARFIKGRREVSEELRRQLQELTSCG